MTVKKEESSHSSWRDGPVGKKRRCTDIIFLFLIIASWVVMTGIGFAATGFIESENLKKGEPEVLFNGMDYLGNICGVTNYTNTLNENILDKPKAYILPSGVNICIEFCPTEVDATKFHCKYEVEAFILEQTKTAQSLHGDQVGNSTKQSLYLYYASKDECMPYVKTSAYLGYCAPNMVTEAISQQMRYEYEKYNITTNANLTVTKEGFSDGGFFDEAVADTYLARHVILVFGVGGAMMLGFAFLGVLRLPGILSLIVWSIIIAIFGMLCASGYYMKETSIRWENEGLKEDHEVKAMYWLSIICYVSAALWFLTVCATRKRIYLAISVVKEASCAISSMPVLILYPILPVLGFVLFLIPWVVYMVYLASSGEIKTACLCSSGDELEYTMDTEFENMLIDSNETSFVNECDASCQQVSSFEYARNTRYAGLYLVFTFFWTTQFIIACMQLCVATSISMWYFTKDKNYVGNNTFFQAICIASFYHLGTCAFGSLILAIVKTIRLVLTYIQKRLARLKNKFAQAVLMSLQCCLCLLEKCIKFVNKNAYIQTAIHGHSFCKGAKEAFYLILRNILRISAVSVVGEIILLVGKLLIVVCSTVSAYLYMEHYYEDQLRGLHTVTSFVFLTSLISAELFNQIFSMAISTILQCFVTDEETFEPEEMYAPGSLANTIEETQKSASMSKIVHPDGKGTIDTDKVGLPQKVSVEDKAGLFRKILPK